MSKVYSYVDINRHPPLCLFTSGIQALIFATLAAAYIGESMEGHH